MFTMGKRNPVVKFNFLPFNVGNAKCQEHSNNSREEVSSSCSEILQNKSLASLSVVCIYRAMSFYVEIHHLLPTPRAVFIPK